MSQKLIGDEITSDLMKRIARLEAIIICQHCAGDGKVQHRTMGLVKCFQCEGTGNRLDGYITEQYLND